MTTKSQQQQQETTLSSGRVDLEVLLKRSRSLEKKEKMSRLVITTASLCVVAVFAIILAL